MNSNSIQWIINFHSFQGRADPKIGDSTCKSYQKCSPWLVRVTSSTLEERENIFLIFCFACFYSKNFFFVAYSLLFLIQVMLYKEISKTCLKTCLYCKTYRTIYSKTRLEFRNKQPNTDVKMLSQLLFEFEFT